MAASKTLILLKGIAGFAAASLATVGGFQVGHKVKTSKALSLEQSDEVTLNVESEPEKYIEGVDDLGIPDGCSETCELSAEQLKNLKFEQKTVSSVAFDGLSNEDTFELRIEESEDKENYPWGKKYILKAKTIAGRVTIRNVKDSDIVLGEDEEVLIREIDGGGGLEKVPEEVDGLGIPRRCTVEKEEESTEQICELTKEQLLRLKFEPKEENSSISVEGQNEGNIVTLKIEDKESDQTNYPKGKKYTLKSKAGTVTIKGTKDGDIVLEGDEGVDFREKQEGSKLETVENSLGIPKSCEASESSCQLTEEQLKKLKFETGDESSIEIDGLGDGTVELKIEDKASDLINYPKGKKYTLKSSGEEVTIKGVKGEDIVLEEGEEGVVIRETSSGGKLEKAPEEVDKLGIPRSCKAEQATEDETQSCELTKEQLERLRFETKGNKKISVEGLTGNNKVTLEIGGKAGDETNYPKGKKYTLTSTNSKVTIKNVKDGDIVLEAKGTVVIRETTKGGKLEEALEEVDELGIPTRCGTGGPCKLTKEQLKRLKFEAKTSSPITVSGLESNDTVDLKVENSKDTTNYPKGKKYTLTSTNSKVTIKGVKKGDIDLETNQGVVIREKHEGALLERSPEEVNELGIPKNCNDTCKLTKAQLRKIKFEPKSGSSFWISGMGNSDRVTLKIENPNDTVNYPKEKKYSFKVEKNGVTIKGTKDWDIDLEKDKEVLIRETSGGGKLETVEDSLGIPKSCNAKKVIKVTDMQTCQLTSDQLKNIKFKTFNGKNAHVRATGLNDKIKLTISWVEDSGTYPGNIKYSFDNTEKNSDIEISRIGQTVTLERKKESWFKNVGGQLELVEANTKAEVKIKETNEILEKLGLGSEKLKLKIDDFNGNSNSTWHNKKTADFYNARDLKKIKFKDLDGNAEKVDSLNGKQKITVFFEWDNAINKFPKNMKFTFENQSFSPSFYFEKSGKNAVQICKKNTNTNPDSIKNRFKVVNELDKWYLVKETTHRCT